MFHAQHVQARGPSTGDERAKVVELARSLEQNPLAHNAAETRQWLREWIADVPDIRFWACTDLLGHALEGSAIGLPSIVIAALILSWSFRRAEEWRSIQTVTLLIALGMLVALLSIIVDVGMPGLQQRVFLSLVLLWLSVVVHRLVRLTGSKSVVGA